MACNDFNNDGILDIDDVYILFAYTQILSRPVFLRPNPVEVSHVQAEYDKLFPGRGAIVVFSPAEAYIRPNGNLYVDYTDEMIRHVILNGLYDDDIRRDVFSHANVDSMLVNDLVSVIEGKGLAKDATQLPSNSAISQHKKKQKDDAKQ